MKLTQQQQDAIEQIRTKNGGVLLPSHVVKEAKKKSSPLHSLFEWDDKRAAELHREQVAREVIRAVKVEYSIETISYATPRYVESPNKENGAAGYSDVDDVGSDMESARKALDAELARIIGNINRAYALAERWGCLDEMEKLERLCQRIREKVTRSVA